MSDAKAEGNRQLEDQEAQLDKIKQTLASLTESNQSITRGARAPEPTAYSGRTETVVSPSPSCHRAPAVGPGLAPGRVAAVAAPRTMIVPAPAAQRSLSPGQWVAPTSPP